MIPDEESMIRTEPRSTERRPETPGLVQSLEQLGFRPFTSEW